MQLYMVTRTGVPRHIQRWRRRYIHPSVVRIISNAHVQVMNAENSITSIVYTSENVFIVLGWRMIGIRKVQHGFRIT